MNGNDPMSDREDVSKRMRDHYEAFWKQGDPWDLERSGLDAYRYQRQAALVSDRRYARVLDVGCGAGQFTRLLADMSDELLALDIAPAAVECARQKCADKRNVSLLATNVMEFDPVAEGPWDLVVMSETIYCLGWLYPLFDIGWLVSRFHAALRGDGRFLLVNTLGLETDYLLLPWLIRTYSDLFLNVGYELEREEIFSGPKHGVELEVMMTLFSKGRA